MSKSSDELETMTRHRISPRILTKIIDESIKLFPDDFSKVESRVIGILATEYDFNKQDLERLYPSLKSTIELAGIQPILPTSILGV